MVQSLDRSQGRAGSVASSTVNNHGTFTGNRALQIEEPLIFEMGQAGRCGVDLPEPPKVKERLNGLRRKGTAAAALDHPMVPLTWLANELSRTGVGMKEGQMVSTGTLTGMLAPKPGETYVAEFGPFGSVTVSFT
jgi:2-keto-4-pentenoate hydratase